MFKRQDKELVPAPQPSPRSMVASAAEITLQNTSWNIYKLREEAWQRELWRLYDLVGEFRFAANWVGSCCSRVRIYVAEVDKFGRIGAEVKNKNKISALADTVLGGPASKSEKLRSIGISLVVAGECYVLGIAADDDKNDQWYVVSPSELHRQALPGTNEEAVLYGDKRLGKTLVQGRDILIRLWTPHPRRMFQADSPSRAATPVLREVEQLTKYVFSQIDSRLVGAGMLPIPNNMEFPSGDGDVGAAESIMRKLAEAGQASLKGEGTAAAVLPVMVEMPIEALDKIKLVRFDSELSGQALDLRKEAISRLALAMDMPPEVLLGTGDTNHWSAWHIEESAVKAHIEPLMTRICEGLTLVYLRNALQRLGEDPDRYTFWYDTSPLTVRPQRLQDTLNLHKEGLVSAQAVLAAGNYLESDAPTEEEDIQRFIRELMLRDPTLWNVPGARELAGITEEMLPADLATPPPPPPPPEQSIEAPGPDPMPTTQGEIPGAQPDAIVASAPVPGINDLAVVVAAESMVRRALELAGGRLLTPSERGRWQNVARHELHTRITVRDEVHAERLLNGAWTHLPALVELLDTDVDRSHLQNALHRYCVTLLTRSAAHDTRLLGEMLHRAGLARVRR